MFLSRRYFRLRHLVLLLVSFAVAWVIFYMKVQHEEEHHAAEQPSFFLPQEGFKPIRPAQIRAWIVVHVNEDFCLHFANVFSGWNILQFGDIQPPHSSARHKECHYLWNEQKSVNADLQTDAFLYAIQRGAEAIYVHSSPQTVNDIKLPEHVTLQYAINGLTVTSSNGYFIPLEHWGCNYTYIKQQSGKHHSYNFCKGLIASVQAEAKYFDIQNAENDLLEITVSESCDSSSPDVALSSGTYACFQRENTLYMRDAFWSLPLKKINDSNTEICLSFLIQRLLWLSGKHLLLHTGILLHTFKHVDKRNIKSCKTFLSGVKCESVTFTACFRKMVEVLPRNMFSKHTVEVQLNWLKSLEAIGYSPPILHPHLQLECEPSELLYSPVDHRVSYKIKKWRLHPFPPINNIAAIHSTYKNICERYAANLSLQPDFLAPWTIWEDVLLVVVFNNPLYDVIPYLEVLYRSFFPHILYCGPSMPESEKFNVLGLYNISFVPYGATPMGHFPGAFNYKCLIMAIEMKYNVRGYLVIADDLLIIPKKLKSFSLEKAWYISPNKLRIADIKTLRECRLGMCDFHTHWRWWEEYQDATLKAMEDMKARQNQSFLINNCLRILADLNHGEFHLNGGYSDIYYIPHYFGESFAELFSIFLRNYVFLEIAVPTAFRCLVPNRALEVLQGLLIWDESRNLPWKYFTKHDLAYKGFLHPAKWSYLDTSSEQYKWLFCSVVSYLHDPYSRINTKKNSS